MIRRYLSAEKDEHGSRKFVAWGIVIFTLMILLFIPLMPPPENLTGFAVQEGLTVPQMGEGNCRCIDVNQDGTVNVVDYNILALRYGECRGSLTYLATADLNSDGCIDNADIICLRSGALRPQRC